MRLLFILSLPRSGSTFLARTLVTHPAITSASHAEPHLFVSAFGPLSGLKAVSAYGAEITNRSALAYLEDTPSGHVGYKTALAEQIANVYRRSAESPSADWFIDKTTRNTLISRDLAVSLPDAHFLVLWRNPLDVLASVYSTWCDDRWTWNANAVELFSGLEGLHDFASKSDPDRILTLRYEDLVGAPQQTLDRVSGFLGLELDGPWDAQRDLSDVRFEGVHDPRARDAVNQKSHKRSLDKWRSTITTRRRRRMARQYLDWIGPSRLSDMGYDHAALTAQLNAITPPFLPSLAEDLRMCLLSLKRLLGVTAWHLSNERQDFGRNALR
ncbi:sulfotransferase family protein [Sagittula stellata]|uniref:sulfotransferase family protein n=1 Tax=Sagittula stellata TaxID=52603 RepID=UPI00321B1608